MGIEVRDWGCGLRGESENITWRKIVQGLSRSPFRYYVPSNRLTIVSTIFMPPFSRRSYLLS